MKILTILNDDSKQSHIELLDDLQKGNDVEVISLTEDTYDYDELVEKIDQCDKVISW